MLETEGRYAIEQLEKSGFQAYFVGGFVRDRLMGVPPHDVDLATDATPEEVMNVFPYGFTIPTGIQHGTITALVHGVPIEITTFRKDGDYADGRHPQYVQFSKTIEEDLSRRDFTVNAMAYHPTRGLVDPFHGEADLAAGVLRCVGNPAERFGEDSLRMLRCLRFSSVLGFSIDSTAAEEIHKGKLALENLPVERIWSELEKMIPGKNIGEILLQYPDVFCLLFPCLAPTVGFDQHNPHHCYDIYTHTCHSVAHACPDFCVRTALLFHDVGKPPCFFLDDKGIGHFYGHGEKSMELAKTALQSLSCNRKQLEEILTLIRYHDVMLGDTPVSIRRWCNRLSPSTLKNLLEVKRGDLSAMFPHPQRIQVLDHQEQLLRELVAKQDCFSLKQLAVNGNDMITVGYKGPAVGEILNQLLQLVISEDLPNCREDLLSVAYAAFSRGSLPDLPFKEEKQE